MSLQLWGHISNFKHLRQPTDPKNVASFCTWLRLKLDHLQEKFKVFFSSLKATVHVHELFSHHFQTARGSLTWLRCTWRLPAAALHCLFSWRWGWTRLVVECVWVGPRPGEPVHGEQCPQMWLAVGPFPTKDREGFCEKTMTICEH